MTMLSRFKIWRHLMKPSTCSSLLLEGLRMPRRLRIKVLSSSLICVAEGSPDSKFERRGPPLLERTASGPLFHAVVIPYPAQGHVTPHLQLARHLVRKHNFSITFVNTTHNHERMMEAQAEAGYNPENSANITFVGLPDKLPPGDKRIADIIHFLRAVMAMGPVVEEFLRNLLAKVPITCVIRDVAMPCAHEPARALGIPVVAFATCSAAGAYIYQNIDIIRDKGFIPIPPPPDPSNPSVHPVTAMLRPALTPEEEAARARQLTGFPGLSPVMRVEDLPTYLVTHDMSGFALKFFTEARNPLVPKCDWVLLNTFYELEVAAIDALRNDGINACPIGPLVLSPQRALACKDDNHETEELVMATSGSALWIEDTASLRWLDEQPPASVIFVSFGSIVSISLQQVQELARGLEMSGHWFMWVVRPDHAQKGEGNKDFITFFAEFVKRTRGRSLIAPWVPQAKVLAHPATAAFLTHCGWNSTLESIAAGVPILAWPQNADQKTNACYITKVWKLGLALECRQKDGLVMRSEVAMKVKRMMAPAGNDDREVNSLRNQAKALELAARKAASPGGSSHKTMANLMENLQKLAESRDDRLDKSGLPLNTQAPPTLPLEGRV